jgi:hypothetical protein
VKISILIILCSSVLASQGAEFFITHDGSSAGDGSPSRAWNLRHALSHPPTVLPGDTLWLRGGVYRGEFISQLAGNPRQPITLRQYPGELAIIDGSLTIEGPWTIEWGFEVCNTDPARPLRQWSRPAGVTVNGAATKLINLVIHDAGQGIGSWSSATNAEIYGCLIYNNGNTEFDHGIYAQNQIGTKRIIDNIIVNNYGYGLHAFGSANASVANFEIEGNTVFNNGSLSPANDAHNILIGGIAMAERIRLVNNFTYGGFKFGAVTLGLSQLAFANQDLVVENNYFADFLEIQNWNRAIVTGNTLVARGTMLGLIDTIGLASTHVWDRNYYFSQEESRPFGIASGSDSSGFSFADWQKVTQFDLNSYYFKARPQGIHTFIRTNRYEPGRASITIYNWSRQKAVPVDLRSVLPIGTWYEVRNAQNYFAPPAVRSRYFGAPVYLPTTDAQVAAPIGLATAVSTAPEFNVFVVLPLSEFPKSQFLWR